jgi:hypothetical protein
MTKPFYIAAKPWREWYAGRGIGMRLSEAIRIGIGIRPETRRERFANMANGGLCSDVWGAACEAVDPSVAKLNWTTPDPFKLEASMRTLREVQQKYFKRYFEMPARCPGAHQPYQKARGRNTGRRGADGSPEVVVEAGAKNFDAGGMTSECDKVQTLAGAADHLFYAHNWTRERVAEIVEWYEETRTDAVLAEAFTHFRSPTLESRINRRLLKRATDKIRQRAERRNFHVN